MPQALLHAGEHALVVPGFDINHAVGRQSRLGDRGSEEVRARDAPEDLALGAGGDACTEERGRSAIDCAIAAASYLMQRATREAPAGKSRVELGNSERKNRLHAPASAFDLLDLRAQ